MSKRPLVMCAWIPVSCVSRRFVSCAQQWLETCHREAGFCGLNRETGPNPDDTVGIRTQASSYNFHESSTRRTSLPAS